MGPARIPGRSAYARGSAGGPREPRPGRALQVNPNLAGVQMSIHEMEQRLEARRRRSI